MNLILFPNVVSAFFPLKILFYINFTFKGPTSTTWNLKICFSRKIISHCIFFVIFHALRFEKNTFFPSMNLFMSFTRLELGPQQCFFSRRFSLDEINLQQQIAEFLENKMQFRGHWKLTGCPKNLFGAFNFFIYSSR